MRPQYICRRHQNAKALYRERLVVTLPGQRYDAVAGLSQNYFRDYEPSKGRYSESDPIGLNGGVSTYAYVASNPFAWKDPAGLVKWTGNVLPGSIGGLVAGGLFVFDLKSQCVNGLRDVLVKAEAGGFGVGVAGLSPANATAGDLVLQDYLPDIHPENFNGVLFTYGAGFIAGKFGYGCNAYSIGSEWTPAVSGLLDCNGRGAGLDASGSAAPRLSPLPLRGGAPLTLRCFATLSLFPQAGVGMPCWAREYRAGRGRGNGRFGRS